MLDDQELKIEELAEGMTDDLIRITSAAIETPFDTDENRGNKVWLYKAVNQCAGAIIKAQQVLAYRRGDLAPVSTDTNTQYKHEQALIKKAETEAKRLREQYS